MQQTTITKGRSSYHISKRNHRLAARFYWYNCIIGLKFSRCLELLDEEFDITEATICDLLSDNAQLITNLERNNVTEKHLTTRYPFMNWKYLHANSSQKSVQLSLDLFAT